VFLQMTARIWAASSLRDRYTCPEPARVQFVTSPCTQTMGKFPSTASLIWRVSCETVRRGGWGTGMRSMNRQFECVRRQSTSAARSSKTESPAPRRRRDLLPACG
jgi:hypothetical protein